MFGLPCNPMQLSPHENYLHLCEKATWSHEHGRTVRHLARIDIDLARLYDYAFRAQAIGTFHATRQAIRELIADQAHAIGGLNAHAMLDRAVVLLKQLEDRAVDPVPDDFRAVISTFYYYDRWVAEVIETLGQAATDRANPRVETILDRFVANIARIVGSCGICPASDTETPDQGTFVVPNLGITIVPLIYGDEHSWNFASLPADGPGVPTHFHEHGVEIHLGFGHVLGRTILGAHSAAVHEGYAMPIPARTLHGFENRSGSGHTLPFIFGSTTLGGWGIIFDVEPRQPESLVEVSLGSPAMNAIRLIDRDLTQAAQSTPGREVLIPASRTSSPDCSGLELAVTRVPPEGASFDRSRYRILRVCSGEARLCMVDLEANLAPHDHVGIPAGISATLRPCNESPLVLLDCTINQV